VIPRDPVIIVDPRGNEHSALEHEAFLVIRDRQSKEQALECKADQQDVEGATLLAGNIEQPVLDGFGKVHGRLSHWR